MGVLARMPGILRLPALLLGSAVVSTVLLSVCLVLLAGAMGFHLPRDWTVAALFVAVAVSLRVIIPAVLIWAALKAMGRCWHWPPRRVAMVASALIGIVAWLVLCLTAREFFGLAIWKDVPLLMLALALPVIVLTGMLLARVIYANARAPGPEGEADNAADLEALAAPSGQR